MPKPTIAVICLLASACSFFAGGYVGEQTSQVESVPVGYYSVVVVDRPVEKIVEVEARVEVLVEVPQKLRDFESKEELEAWLEQNEVDTTVLIWINHHVDCDDYALRLIEDARKDGYDLHFQIDKIGNRGHALCCAIIGNEIYFIEPQTDEYWYVARVD